MSQSTTKTATASPRKTGREATEVDKGCILTILLLARNIQDHALGAYSDANYGRIKGLLKKCDTDLKSLPVLMESASMEFAQCPEGQEPCGDMCVPTN